MLASVQAELDGLSLEWQSLLRPILGAPEHAGLWRALAAERGPIYPEPGQWLRAFQLCPLARLQVVILGQDPYHGPGQAEGLSFSVPAGVAIPPSLRNILRALVLDEAAHAQPRLHGHLGDWAEQGVLLLNQVWTVRPGQANSHAKLGWQAISSAVLTALATRPAHAYLLWGKAAQALAPFIGEQHLQLHSVHPSPLSAHRGFLLSRPFSQVNQWLLAQGRPGIRW